MKYLLTTLAALFCCILSANAQIWFPQDEQKQEQQQSVKPTLSNDRGSKPSAINEVLLPETDLTPTPEKIRRLKRNSTIMAITGVSSFLVGTAGLLSGIAMLGLSDGDCPPGVVLTAVGGTLFVGSIPVMIMAYKTRGKARKLELGLHAGAFQSLTPAASRGTVPALSLTLDF